MRSTCVFSAVVIAAVATLGGLGGCSPTKEGMKNRQAANDRMNLMAAQVNYEQSRQLFASGQLDKALREVDKAIERYSNSGEYYLQRGRILLEQARLEQALDGFTTALEKNPQLADAQYYAGVVYQRWSDDEQAYTCYRAAFDLAPDKEHYLQAAAESLVSMGEFDQAEQLIEPKMAYFEHNAGLRQLQAQIAMLKGDAKRAAGIYAEARLLAPDDEALLEEMMWSQYAAGMYAQCYESAKSVQANANKNQAAKTVSTGDGQAPPPPRTDIAHLQARCLAMMGRGVEAREMYLQLVKTRPSDASMWSEFGTLAWELNDYRNLVQAGAQMTAIAPDRYEGYLFRAVVERQKGNTEASMKLLQEACQRAGGVALPFLMLGQSLEQSGDKNAAKLAYNQALQVDPDSAEAKAFLRRLNGDGQITAAPIE